MSELHIYREGDEVRIEGKGKVSEIRQDVIQLVKDVDETVVGPRLTKFAEHLKPYLAK